MVDIAGRLGLLVKNILVLIPVFIVIVVSAILSSVGATNFAQLDPSNENVKRASQFVTNITIALWSILVVGFILTGVIGIFIIQIPYLYGGALIIYSLVNLVFAGILFYAAWAARTSSEYTKPDDPKHEQAQIAFNNMLICGVLMLVAAIFTFIYAVYVMNAYSEMGGLSADAAFVATALTGGEADIFEGLTEQADPTNPFRNRPLSRQELAAKALELLTEDDE